MRIVSAGSTGGSAYGHVQTASDRHRAREVIPLTGKTEGLISTSSKHFQITVAGKAMRNIERTARLRQRQLIVASGQRNRSAGTAEDEIDGIRCSAAYGCSRTSGKKPVATEVRIVAGNDYAGRPDELNITGS